MPAAQANLYASKSDLESLLSALGVDARLDDDSSATLDAGEATLLSQCLNWATAQVKFYCQPHYDNTDLAGSWLVNEWATVLAAVRLCSRRLNAVPDALHALAYGDGTPQNRGVLGDLQDVRATRAQIPDAGKRNVDWPAWSNVTVDPRYRLKQIRVQRPISEKTPTQYTQAVDWPSEVRVEI